MYVLYSKSEPCKRHLASIYIFISMYRKKHLLLVKICGLVLYFDSYALMIGATGMPYFRSAHSYPVLSACLSSTLKLLSNNDAHDGRG